MNAPAERIPQRDAKNEIVLDIISLHRLRIKVLSEGNKRRGDRGELKMVLGRPFFPSPGHPREA